MKKRMPTEFVFSLFSLLIAVILVHSIYLTIVLPNAAVILAEQNAMVKSDPDYVVQTSLYVIIRDPEQESEIILMLWAFAILGYKAWSVRRESRMLQREFIPIAEGMKILPEDTREYARALHALPDDEKRMLVPRVLLNALGRFGATRNVQDVSSSVHTMAVTEADRMESELSTIRYIAWAIPAIGFIGTVRGIGGALAQAHRALVGDISGVTENLGVAFNSTFVALLISIALMLIIGQLQLIQERLVFETENYVDEHLIRHLQTG